MYRILMLLSMAESVVRLMPFALILVSWSFSSACIFIVIRHGWSVFMSSGVIYRPIFLFQYVFSEIKEFGRLGASVGLAPFVHILISILLPVVIYRILDFIIGNFFRRCFNMFFPSKKKTKFRNSKVSHNNKSRKNVIRQSTRTFRSKDGQQKTIIVQETGELSNHQKK